MIEEVKNARQLGFKIKDRNNLDNTILTSDGKIVLLDFEKNYFSSFK